MTLPLDKRKKIRENVENNKDWKSRKRRQARLHTPANVKGMEPQLCEVYRRLRAFSQFDTLTSPQSSNPNNLPLTSLD